VIANLTSNNQGLFIPLTNGSTSDGREYSFGLRGWHILLALSPFVFFLLFRKRGFKLEEKYRADCLKYEKKLIGYKKEVAKHLKIINEINKAENLKAHREKLSQDFFYASTEPDLLRREVNKGKYEDLFFKYLSKYFGTKIYNNLQLGYFENPYVPDFSYCDHDRKIYIDIEIDEPYVLTTGEPIHYIGKDDNRDAYFSENGWTVIRFAEKQIANYPLKCCKQIESLIQHLYNNVSLEITIEKKPQWTKSQAEEFYFSKIRNKY
jgi:hypothetical protein